MSLMEIELATIQDVPALLDLQRKAFGPLCEELGWEDAPILSEPLEYLIEEFSQCTTLKVENEEGLIIGSVNGKVTDGSLYIGRLMVLPEYQQRGIGKRLFREIQSRLPHPSVARGRIEHLPTCQPFALPLQTRRNSSFRHRFPFLPSGRRIGGRKGRWKHHRLPNDGSRTKDSKTWRCL